jgi:hypothetical protein
MGDSYTFENSDNFFKNYEIKSGKIKKKEGKKNPFTGLIKKIANTNMGRMALVAVTATAVALTYNTISNYIENQTQKKYLQEMENQYFKTEPSAKRYRLGLEKINKEYKHGTNEYWKAVEEHEENLAETKN